jgi:hypothetical protein
LPQTLKPCRQILCICTSRSRHKQFSQ